jgi:hypothetical protein
MIIIITTIITIIIIITTYIYIHIHTHTHFLPVIQKGDSIRPCGALHQEQLSFQAAEGLMSGTDTGPEWISEMPCPIGTSSPSKLHAPKSNFLWGSVSTFRCAGSLFEREFAGESLHKGPNPLLVMLQTKRVMLLVAILTRIRMITSFIHIH